MKDRRYWEAQRQYAALQKLFPGYQDAGMEEEIAQAVEKAQLLLQKAKRRQAGAGYLGALRPGI